MAKFWFLLEKLTSKYRKVLLGLVFVWGAWTFGLGFLGGWFLNKGALSEFPEVGKADRILILAPHIDDETIGAGGIIQRAISSGAVVKVVYFDLPKTVQLAVRMKATKNQTFPMLHRDTASACCAVVYLTNGDDGLLSVVEEEKSPKITPEEFVALGEKRMEEGKRAMKTLGLGEDSLSFLGFPDRGLLLMLGQNYKTDNPAVAKGTRFNHNPYRGTYKAGELYAGENLIVDLKEIIEQFQPDIILSSHPRDKHPDHRATYQFLESTLNDYPKKAKVFTYLVHFPGYPSSKKLKQNEFLYPPKKLFSQEGWFSYELSEEEGKGKFSAMEKYKSQKSPIPTYDLLDSFVKRNEIFEEF